ncbi:MAG: M16 family metallopeptidase [Planctomycetota bacterium]|jgi:predicted Zn-dependent peptidase
MSGIVTTSLACGATLLVEPIPSMRSVSMSWLLPVGSATDPPDGDGLATVLSELIFRGAGGLSSREHSDALDRLGVQRSSQVSTHHLRLSAAMVGERTAEALRLLVPMVREPVLPADGLDAVRSLCLQELDSLADDPQHLVMLRLRERHLPAPFNRHGYGQREVLERCTIDDLREAWRARCRPQQSILAFAGAIDPEACRGWLDELLEGWSGEVSEPAEVAPPKRGRDHLTQATAQMHIGMALDAPPEADSAASLERLAVGVHSGGTSARLFTEVRQKRSLCYSVGASYHAGRDRGLVALYAGTTPDRAQETLDVCAEEIHRLAAGVEADEFQRAVLGATSHLVMQGESSAARAAAIASDQYRLGRARTLAERRQEVESVDLEKLNDYLRQRTFGELTVASIGPVEPAVPVS